MATANLMTSVILFPSVDDAIEKIRDNPEKYGNLEYPGEMKILYNNFRSFPSLLLVHKAVQISQFQQNNGTTEQYSEKGIY
jgi:hypothetical protein